MVTIYTIFQNDLLGHENQIADIKAIEKQLIELSQVQHSTINYIMHALDTVWQSKNTSVWEMKFITDCHNGIIH